MKVDPIEFYELARASHIKRWHIVNTAKEQNLAEHHYNVTIIAMELHKRILGGLPSAQFMAAALFHDVSEIRYGDVPTPGKKFLREYYQIDLFDVDKEIMPELPFVCGEIGFAEREVIKLADLIEAAWWVRENGLGHHASVVADKCWRLVVEFVSKIGHYDAANFVLTNLGMPYISPASQVNQL